MDKIELFLFGKKLSVKNNLIIIVFTLASIGWYPGVAGVAFVESAWDYILFAFIFSGVIIPLYAVNGKIIASKQESISLPIILVCLLSIVIENCTIIYLYSYKIFESKESLWVTIPASVIISVVSIIWMRYYRER